MTASDDDLIQKGQDDLIRRVDARRILEEEGFLERSLANLNNLPAVQVTAYSENDVAALVALMPEVIASLDTTNCNISLVRDLRAAIARVKGGAT